METAFATVFAFTNKSLNVKKPSREVLELNFVVERYANIALDKPRVRINVALKILIESITQSLPSPFITWHHVPFIRYVMQS